MRAFKSLSLQVAVSILWPIYMSLFAYAARVGPWPRTIARPASFSLMVMAWILFAAALARFLFGPHGWAEQVLHAPTPAARQIRRALWFLCGGVLLFLLPSWLLERGLIASGDRPVTAPETCRALVLSFEALLLIVAFRVTRKKAPLVQWLTGETVSKNWFNRHPRFCRLALLSYLAAILVLDVQGFGFTARRISSAGLQTTILAAACWFVYWSLEQLIEHYAWHWVRRGETAAPNDHEDAPADVAGKLRKLAAWGVPMLGVVLGSWFWNIDLALFRSITDQPIWPNAPAGVTIGDVVQATILAIVTFLAWRHLSTLFTMLVYPRITDDPGIRFAVLTLCRYLVLGVGLMATMASLHMGPEKIGFGVAALSVGLGFGLQEIVSNFVSGIILLLERPIRVGDVVTVAGMSGKVERINIRATTIINADNQSLIVPNREFITANLVNWTHKDRILRVSIPVCVAYGTDPDCVSDLLLAIARNDVDVLRNPVSAACLDGFGQFGMLFNLHVHVPDPGLAGRVKHRLCTEIQKQFQDRGITIPMPSHEVTLKSTNVRATEPTEIVWPAGMRVDAGSPGIPAPKLSSCPVCSPQPAEPSHRGVDE